MIYKSFIVFLLLLELIQRTIQFSYQTIIPQKSQNDKLQYQALILSNQIKVLFIHDQNIEKSVYSVSVNAGSMHNPNRSLGLAHFLQHMLFMGSEKYPQESSYSHFIEENSGQRNGFTSGRQTWYYLEVKNSAFVQGVDRLTDFFISPLIKQDSLQRERQAVHNEFSLSLGDDQWRTLQVLRSLASYPYSQFSTGNNQTLSHKQIYNDLITFYKTYYSSNLINAVFYSKMPIQKMKKQFIPLLQKIPNRNTKLPQFSLHFKQEQRGKFIRMQSIKNQKFLKFLWIVELLEPLYKNKVDIYIKSVLNYKGKNSLLSSLKQKSYILDLTCDINDQITQSIISLQIKLTDLGYQNYVQIYQMVINFVYTLRANKLTYNLVRQINQLKFNFREKVKISEYSMQLLRFMYYVPLEEIVIKNVLFNNFHDSEVVINRIFFQLAPQNSIVILSSKQQLQNPLIGQFLKVRYLVQALPIRTSCFNNFQQQYQNIYLPINTTILNFTPTIQPQKISTNLYLLQDRSYNLPKGGIQLSIYVNQTPQLIQFFIKYIELTIQQYIQPAKQLQTEIKYKTDYVGNIKIFGFTDTVIKLYRILIKLLKKLNIGQANQNIFNQILQKIITQYKNKQNQRQDIYGSNILKTVLVQDTKSMKQILKQFQKYQYQEIIQRIRNMLEFCVVRWVAVGNFQRQELIDLVGSYNKQMVKDKIIPKYGTLKIKKPTIHKIFLQSSSIGTSCTILSYQIGPYTQQLFYKVMMIKNYADAPYFNQLRTIKQIAYLLGIVIDMHRGILGLRFILISSTHHPERIANQIKLFLEVFFSSLIENLTKYDNKNYKKLKESVYTTVLEPHQNLNAYFEFISKQIFVKTYFFKRKQPEEINKYLNGISAESLVQLWRDIENKRMEIHIVCKKHEIQYRKQQKQIQKVEKQYWDDLMYCCN